MANNDDCLDKQTLETVKSILKREYDLEIFLKRREVEMIRKELEQGERLLSLLRKAILSGKGIRWKIVTKILTLRYKAIQPQEEAHGHDHVHCIWNMHTTFIMVGSE
jgi:hypothetical protein